MIRRSIFALLALFALSPISVAFAQSKSQPNNVKPNIIVIMADDLGYHDLGFQGSTHIKTPNVDWLAANGTRFTDGHVSASVCSPSRAGMMTGRYQQRFGHEANVPKRPHGMDPKERTIGQALQGCGYRTAVIGKWHLGDEEHHYPTARGFDEFWGLREGSRTYWYEAGKGNDKPGNPKNIEHNGKPVAFEGHLTDRMGDRAVEFIEAESDKPFFVFLSFTAPHGPLQSKPEDMAALGTKDNYAGLVYGMDRNVGKVIQALKKNKQLDNTMIWFLSDNCGTVKQASNKPLGGKKGTKFEGGMRVPFVLCWKGKVQPAADYDSMISALDIYPTSVKAAGGSLEQPRPLDGVDLLPFLNGKQDGKPHEQLYWRKLECAAMRDGNWKMIRVAGLDDHLFNLTNDIAEQKDLASQNSEQLKRMQGMLKQWEADKIEPIWKEGAVWTKVRYQYHKSWFETGKAPKSK
jgi:arylsulfatase A-like enzyme